MPPLADPTLCRTPILCKIFVCFIIPLFVIPNFSAIVAVLILGFSFIISMIASVVLGELIGELIGVVELPWLFLWKVTRTPPSDSSMVGIGSPAALKPSKIFS